MKCSSGKGTATGARSSYKRVERWRISDLASAPYAVMAVSSLLEQVRHSSILCDRHEAQVPYLQRRGSAEVESEIVD